MPDVSTVAGQAAIDHMIQDAEVVFVDNLSCWARSGRENEAESWLPIADWILSLRRRGIAVVLVHHAGKGGQQRGTSKREDLLDVVIGLSRPKDYLISNELQPSNQRGSVGGSLRRTTVNFSPLASPSKLCMSN